MAGATVEIPAEELYRTSTILEAIIQLPPASVFLRDKLFGKVQLSESDLVAVTYMKGSQKLSPFCSRYSKGTAIPRGKEQLRVFSPPFIKPNRMLSADDTFRVAGQLAGGKASAVATDRDAALLAIDTSELDSMISRREEKMCSDVLFEGVVTCLDGDTGEVTAEIDYSPISKTVTAKPWSDPTSNPLDDLKNAQRLVSGASGFNANFIVMGRLAGDAFETNSNVLTSYDKQHITPGLLSPKALDDVENYGITVLGTWRGLPLYVSETQYEDTDGSMKYFCPEKSVLVAAAGLQGTMAYAAVAQVNEGGTGRWPIAGRRIPLVYYDTSGEDYRRLRLSSRPIPIPANTDSWTVLTVLA